MAFTPLSQYYFLYLVASLYALVKALAKHLEIPLAVFPSNAPPAILKGLKHRGDNVPPELAIVSTVLIGLKLIYGFNGKDV